MSYDVQDALRRLRDARTHAALNRVGYASGDTIQKITQAVANFIVTLSDELARTAKIVPMTRGRLQLEWYRGDRSLELEFSTPETLCYLKWDSAEDIDDEGTIGVNDTESIQSLLAWLQEVPLEI